MTDTRTWTPEIRRQQSLNAKRQWQDPEYRAKMAAILRRPEHLAHLRRLNARKKALQGHSKWADLGRTHAIQGVPLHG